MSRNYTSLLKSSYLSTTTTSSGVPIATAAAKAAAAAAAVEAALAKSGGLDDLPTNGMKREAEEESREERRKRRKSRWGGSEHEKTFIPGMPTVLPTNLTPDQEKAYLYQLQIEEISRKLRTGDLGVSLNPEERSPSPEPLYSSDGKRLNTREYRTRRKLEEERHNLIQKILKINPEFKPPPDYKPPVIRVHNKVMIPQEEHPDINFVGLLIGPRGNTLKSMEKETGAKIIIRGKGSVKEGKVGRKDGQPLPGEDEPLHAYITANNLEAVKKAVERIHEIIRQGVEVPEGQNDLRRNQLRELALLNGTLRENDVPRCANCGASDHKTWVCPDKPNITNSIVCTSCGSAGHIARDCREKRPSMGGTAVTAEQASEKTKIDEEYMSLMAELGEGPPPDRSKTQNNQNRSATNTPSSYPGLFDRQQTPRALMAAPAHPPPGMMSQTGPPQMMAPPPPGMGPPPPGMGPPPPGMAPPPPGMGPPPPGMAPPPPGMVPPWSQPDMSNMNGMNNMNSMNSMSMQQWGQPPMPVSMPPPPGVPGVMQPPPPPPGSSSQPLQPVIPPLMPWMTPNNQPPPPGQVPPPPPPGIGIPPWQHQPQQQSHVQCQAVPPPGVPPPQPPSNVPLRPPVPGTVPPPGYPQGPLHGWGVPQQHPPMPNWGAPVPPPPTSGPTPPGIDLNSLPTLLAQPPPPPPPTS